MSLEVYNDLLSKMLDTQWALTKIKSELQGREGKKCWGCKQFGHLAKNCRNRGGRVEEKKKMTNRFKALTSRIMQCGVKEVRQQEVVEERRWCFRCGEEEHKKWECSKGNEKRREEAVPLWEVWGKIKEHYGVKGLPPRGAVMSMKGWMTR